MSLTEAERRAFEEIEQRLALEDQGHARNPDVPSGTAPRGANGAVLTAAAGLVLLILGSAFDHDPTLILGLFVLFGFPLPLQLTGRTSAHPPGG